MIRYIHIGGQITEGDNDFAWFDTVTDRFLEFNGTHVWGSWNEFTNDYGDGNIAKFLRFMALYPKRNVTYS